VHQTTPACVPDSCPYEDVPETVARSWLAGCARGRERRRFHPVPSRTGSCQASAPESTARGTAWEARPLRAQPARPPPQLGVNSHHRGVEQWQLVGLITRRSWVRIPPPLPERQPPVSADRGFSCLKSLASGDVAGRRYQRLSDSNRCTPRLTAEDSHRYASIEWDVSKPSLRYRRCPSGVDWRTIRSYPAPTAARAARTVIAQAKPLPRCSGRVPTRYFPASCDPRNVVAVATGFPSTSARYSRHRRRFRPSPGAKNQYSSSRADSGRE
jgi:hypothetical protein